MIGRISVIIPSFNSAKWIRQTLESVSRQTRRPDEIWVVDDASSDETPRLVQASGVDCCLIRQEHNAGPAAARNRGIAAAQGEWIAFLDADDLWLPERLSLQCALARKHPDVALWCGAVIEFTEPDVGSMMARPENQMVQQVSWQPLTLDDFVSGNQVATSTVLVKVEALQAVGGFDEAFRGPEDYDLWMRLAARYKLGKLNSPVSAYRQRPGSLSQDDRTFLPQILRVLEKAFATGGAMAGMVRQKKAALSNQYWNASWMAFNRGSRVTAIRHLLRAYILNRSAGQGVERKWGPLLFRYVMGTREIMKPPMADR